MKIKRNSLLLKIIFYNDMAIVLTSLLIAMTMIFISIKEIDLRIEDNTRNKLTIFMDSYNSYFLRLENRLYKELSNYRFKDDFDKLTNYLEKNLEEEKINPIDIVIVNKSGELLSKIKTERLSIKERKYLIELAENQELDKKSFYLMRDRESVVSNIILKIEEKRYIILTLPITEEFFKSLIGNLKLTGKDRTYFYLNDGRNREIYERSNFFTKKIQHKEYYLGVYNLFGYKKEYLGSFVLAISKENLKKEKISTAIHILIFLVFAMLIITTLTSKVFKRMLEPLIEISTIANKISKGDKVEKIEIIGAGEIRELSIAFKDMVERLNDAQKCLEKRNRELLENISRIQAIDEILLNANIETDTLKLVINLLKGFTSKEGLNYSRAMYFRYSRENDYLIGEKASINSFLESGDRKSLKFQTRDLEKLITNTKVTMDKNLISESFIKKRVICRNDYGYKYDLGNDLLKAIGIKNFFIFPIYGAGKFSGAILVDNYTKDVKIKEEELELLNLLALNFSTGVIDRQQIISRLESQRVTTIEKLANKFLNLRGKVVELLLECLDSKNPEKKIVEELNSIKPLLQRIKQDNLTLKQYSSLSGNEYDIISLEQIVTTIIENQKSFLERNDIEISVFFATEGIIYGCKRKIELALIEILKNAYTTLLRNKDERRINIILAEKIKNKKIELKIIDNGEGISKERLMKIYEPFETFEPENLGLGLFFVKKIIREHNGVIKHFSELGKGTEVKITFNAYMKEEL